MLDRTCSLLTRTDFNCARSRTSEYRPQRTRALLLRRIRGILGQSRRRHCFRVCVWRKPPLNPTKADLKVQLFFLVLRTLFYVMPVVDAPGLGNEVTQIAKSLRASELVLRCRLGYISTWRNNADIYIYISSNTIQYTLS